MQNPDVEVLSGETREFLHTMGLIPIYPLTEGLGQKKIRRLVHAALDDFLDRLEETLPDSLIQGRGLLSRGQALRGIHFPRTHDEIEKARERIAFEELLALQLCLRSATSSQAGTGIAHGAEPTLTRAFRSHLPFTLTDAQERAIAGIFRRMESSRQMNVLLQGDVGSGKTVVSACAMLKAVENGRQAVLMAPTEILAEQHLSSLGELLRGVNVETVLLSGRCPSSERRRATTLMASGRPALVVGTHALIESSVTIPNASLVVIDEQHRFGVNQRAALRQKGVNPDLIVMTATPIPRTLALALYGDFEVVTIDTCPPERHPVETRHIPDAGRNRMYRLLRETLSTGRQAFVVCPEIGERSDSGAGAAARVTETRTEYAKAFPDCRIGVLHGRLCAEEREKALTRFRNNDFDILVATTLIEVGIDIPNASVMVIESADRFGLAQLHQLRGRVGRSVHKSHCFLVAEPSTPEAIRRIELMTTVNDGFALAEHDMYLRGPGEFLGTAQSGIPPLRVAHLVKDFALLEQARETATAILDADPQLMLPENRPLRALLGDRMRQNVDL